MQFQFDNGGRENQITANVGAGQHNLIVDLGRVDFEKDPNPKEITFGTQGIKGSPALAIEGHVYLERVRDDAPGNDFYVMFQVVALDPFDRYIAFIWRQIPGGTVRNPVKRE